jgi:cleavage and polyadenylation specificity factor subunit 1
VQNDCRTWARACQSCQRYKVSRHTLTHLGDFTPLAARFLHVHVYLFGPLPTSVGYTYCLAAVGRFTRWPEVIPIPDITADTVASVLLTGWISRFVCPQTNTTGQGRQFESQIFQSLARMCGIQPARTTAHHLAANGPVERFHRTLKAVIICHADQQWTEALPLVLLGIGTAYKVGLRASVTELVYGEPLRIPGELLTPTAEPVDPAHLITELRRHMARLRPVPAPRHTSPSTFVHSDIERCTHVFLRQETTRRALEPLYSGPYQVLSWRATALQLLVRGRPVTVSNDMVKPAYSLKGTDRGRIFNPPAATTPAAAPSVTPPQPSRRTTRSGRHIHFPARLNI